MPESNSQFMKLEIGANKFRILSDIVIGWEGWKNKKPFRHEGQECRIMPEQVDLDNYGKPNIKHFWAMVIWDYKTQMVKTLEITQSTVMSVIRDHEESEEWGDCKAYDITISKEGSGKETVYTVVMSPPKPISTEVENAYINANIDLSKLFEGGYPQDIQTEDDPDSPKPPF